jgi:hypothetical protein
MLFFGRRGREWHLFVTGVFAQDRFARLAADVLEQFRRFEIPQDRLTVMVPASSAGNPAESVPEAQP